MKSPIRLLLIPILMTFGFLAGAVGQGPAASNKDAVLLAASLNPLIPPAFDVQTTEQALSESLEPQPQIWTDHNAVEGLNDVLFDLDVYQVVSEPETLQADAQWLKDHPDVQVNLAGYADTRGDIVYNLALSQQRANTVKQKLVEMGIAENRIVFATGWGKLYQNCLDPTEDCWKQNRRVQFEYANPFANGRTGGPSR